MQYHMDEYQNKHMKLPENQMKRKKIHIGDLHMYRAQNIFAAHIIGFCMFLN